jgi:hypothetical protein
MNKTILAQKYGISLPTLNKWLADIPELKLRPYQRIFTPRQLDIIDKEIG